MRPLTGTFILPAFLLSSLLVEAVPIQDAPGCLDHPLLTRMPGFHIEDCEVREFDAYEFRGPDGESIRVEGRKTYLDYGLERGAQPPSELQILRNHNNAIRKIGGVIVWEDGHNTHLNTTAGGRETWVHVRVYNQATAYSLYIIQTEEMVQQVVASAESMARDLANTGKVALYGIYFDFDKSVVKPESEPTLREIAKLLRDNPELRIHVVGHTDSVGGLEYNLELSRRRAAAVVEQLTTSYGISLGRLRPAGVGPLAPAASNATEEGRASNRRVELVKQ